MRNKRKLAIVIAVVILTLSMASTGFAKTAMENLTAYYRNITIFRNGTQATFTHEPFIVDGTTYVPVRDMSELLGKTVTFNPQTYRIDITDVADPNTIMLQTKVIQQEVTIKNLETKVKNLEAQLASKQSSKPSTSTLSAMEDYLNDKYSPEDKIDFIIELKGTKNNVELGIYVDDRTSSDRFDDWVNSDKKSYAEELVDELIDEFDSNKISGFYKDDYTGTSKQSFSVSSSGKVTMGGSSSSGYDLDDLEYDLYDEFYSYYGITDIEVEGSKSDIDVFVYVDEDDWDSLSKSRKNDVADYILDFIEEEFPKADVYGEIIDDWDDYVYKTFKN